MKRAGIVGMALLLLAGTCSAGDVLMYRAGDAPDPQAMAAILSRPATGLKMRSIRMLPEAAVDAAAVDSGSAPTAPVASPAAEAPRAVAAASLADREAPASVDSFAMPVPFAFDSARVLPGASTQLDALAAAIKLTGKDVHVLIEGHTDAVGSEDYNLVLSLRRAQAVKSYLVAHGISGDRLHVAGMGKSMPINRADPSAAENRRVQFRALSDSERVAGSAPKRS